MAPRSGRVNPQVQTRGAARSFVQNLDTYYQPARDTRKEQALQSALGQFSNMYEKRAQEVQQERREGFFQQGTLDSMREQAGQELKGVREGNIFRQNSRFYEMGLNEGRGSIAGIEFQENLEKAWKESGIGYGDDAAFSQWLDGHAMTFLEGLSGNQYALGAAMPKVQQGVESFAKQWANQKNAAIAAERASIFERELLHTLGSNAGAAMDDAVMQKQLYDLREEYFATDGPVANKRFIEGAIKWARITDDPTAMNMIIRNAGPDGFNLGLDEYEDLVVALDQTETRIAADTAAREKAEKAQREAYRSQVVGSLTDDLISDPYTNMNEVFTQITEQNGGVPDLELFGDLLKLQENVQKANERATAPAEPEGVQMYNFYLEMQNAGTWRDKMGIIGTYAEVLGKQVTTYMDEINPTKGYEMWIKNPTNKAEFDSYVDGIKLLESADETTFAIAGQQGRVAVVGEAALRRNIHSVRKENPDMTDFQVLEEAGKRTGQFLYRQFGKDEVFIENLQKNPEVSELLQLTVPQRTEAVVNQADAAVLRAEVIAAVRRETMNSMLDDAEAAKRAVPGDTEEAEATPRGRGRNPQGTGEVMSAGEVGSVLKDFFSADFRDERRPVGEAGAIEQLEMEAIDIRIEELKAAQEVLQRATGKSRNSSLTQNRLEEIAKELAALEAQQAAIATKP